MTFQTFDQSYEETWPDQKNTITKTNTKTKTMTKTNTFREYLQRAIPENCDLWDIWSEWWGDMTWPKTQTKTKTKTMTMTNTFREHLQRGILETCDNPTDLWHLSHWLQFRQLRTWIDDNFCYLTINCDTGQHSQFLRCFSLVLFILCQQLGGYE